ncbi:ankyrin repeat-containing domain protein [Tuber brumale]|nr:ankyrin repeat-containing domain protein [Tuber brumale]
MAAEHHSQRKEVNAEAKDNKGRTPLSCAAESGNVGVVTLLLEREEVNANVKHREVTQDREVTQNATGSAPLSHAAESGNPGVVELFLERDEVNGKSTDNNGRTPLSYAARSRNEGVVEMLPEWKEVNAESKGNEDRTPLSYAAESGNHGVLRLFLKWDEVNAESKDNQGRTPPSHAAEFGNVGVVKLFLEREEVNLESKDIEGVKERRSGERGEVNTESKDNWGRTPLAHAAEFGNVRVLKLFLEREEVNAESEEKFGWTPLFYAFSNGPKEIRKMILALGEASPRFPALFEDAEAARLLRECLDTMRVPQHHDVRTPNPHPERDSQEAESPVQPPLQLRNSNTNTHQESAQQSSLPTLLLNDHYQNPEIPTQHSKRNLPNLPLTYPVLPAVNPTGSLDAFPRLSRTNLRLISPQKAKSPLSLPTPNPSRCDSSSSHHISSGAI